MNSLKKRLDSKKPSIFKYTEHDRVVGDEEAEEDDDDGAELTTEWKESINRKNAKRESQREKPKQSSSSLSSSLSSLSAASESAILETVLVESKKQAKSKSNSYKTKLPHKKLSTRREGDSKFSLNKLDILNTSFSGDTGCVSTQPSTLIKTIEETYENPNNLTSPQARATRLIKSRMCCTKKCGCLALIAVYISLDAMFNLFFVTFSENLSASFKITTNITEEMCYGTLPS